MGTKIEGRKRGKGGVENEEKEIEGGLNWSQRER